MSTPDFDYSIVAIETSDGKQWQILRTVAKVSETLSNLMEDANTEDVIPLPNIEGNTFEKYIEYTKYHLENDVKAVVAEEVKPTNGECPTPAPESFIPSEVPLCKFDEEFIKMENSMLFKIIKAANYLDNKPLLLLCCRGIAMQLKGKTTAEIRKIFNITKDVTPEDEERIMKENNWFQEK